MAGLSQSDLIVIGVPSPAPTIVGLPLNRRGRDFSEREGVRLTVTHLPASAEGEADGLLLEEERSGLADSALAALGLTRRQAQVLRLADRGLTNDQIAAETGVSTRTVEKHLEHVYARLGVPGRTAALAKARAAAA